MEKERLENASVVVEKTPIQLHEEITKINAEIAELISIVKNNEVLAGFAKTVKESGGFGVMGLLPKIPSILPELAPLFPALQKLVEVGEKQHKLTGEIIKQLGVKSGG